MLVKLPEAYFSFYPFFFLSVVKNVSSLCPGGKKINASRKPKGNRVFKLNERTG